MDGRSVTKYVDRKLRNGAPYAVYDGVRPLEGVETVPSLDIVDTRRTPPEILEEINQTKRHLESDLKYCQDYDTKIKLEAKARNQISLLWDEYREANGQ